MANKFVQVGNLQKSFGTEGYLKFKLFSDYKEDVQKAEFLWLMHDDYYVPYRIVQLNNSKKMIQFDDVFDIENAAKIHNKALHLRIDQVTEKPDEKEFLEDFSLYNCEEFVGKVNEIRTIAGHLYAILDYQGKEIMIPVHENLILEIDSDNEIVRMDLPDGILEL